MKIAWAYVAAGWLGEMSGIALASDDVAFLTGVAAALACASIALVITLFLHSLIHYARTGK